MIRSIAFAILLATLLPIAALASNDSLVVGEPRTYGRLTVFPIESQNQSHHTYLTLEEALRTGRAIIHENNSQKLWIVNLSDTDLYIESTEILKGGQQDRMVESDMIIPAYDTDYTLHVYCVEKGRSTRRYDEPIETFSGSSELAPMHHMRVVARHELTAMLLTPHLGGLTAPDPDELKLMDALGTMPQFNVVTDAAQESIWHDVSQTQSALTNVLKDSVTRNESPTSLELALENTSLQEKRHDYEKRLGDLASDDKNSIGVIYALDGKIVGGDVYASHTLFASMWPKHLRAMATEAIALPSSHDPTPALTKDAILDFLTASTPGKTAKKQVNDRTLTEAIESQNAFIFTTRDAQFPEVVVHRGWVVK